MLEILTLASGSEGNATLVRGGGTAILIDAGLTAKQLTARLLAGGLAPEELSGILLTHEHADHTSALRVLLARTDLPVYCNPLTARALRDGGIDHGNWQLFANGAEFAIGALAIRAFSVPHDAADPVGYRISFEGRCLGLLTDLGYATRLVFDALRGVRALLIEANHDEELLRNDRRRPWSVKQRILSRHGHLSNAAAARVLGELDAPLEYIILGHLSRDCNAPELALGAVSVNGFPHAQLHCARQDEPGPILRIV